MSSREDWQRRLGPLYGGAVALVHSTPWRWPTEVSDDSRSAGWIVALGVPIGVVAWLVAAALAKLGIAPSIAALIGLAMLTVASAALIERGLVERIDRLQGQARSPTVAAVIVLVFTMLVRAAAIFATPPGAWLAVFVATSVVGRWAAVFLQGLGDPILDPQLGRSLVGTPTPAWLTAALSVAVVALTLFALGKVGIIAIAITAVAAFALGLDAQRRDRGLSASVVAVAAAIGELAVLVVAASP